MESKEYIVLYTHQKTKKSKKWQDGKLKITQNGRIELLDDSNNKVETVYVKAGQIQVGEEVESDRHLITIEEVCNKSCDVNRLNQDSIAQIPEKTNERMQPVCRQPLRKRRMGFTVPRQLNQHTVSADNDVETSVQYSQNSEGSLNYESKLPQSLETQESLLSSPLFSSKPHQRLSCKVVHQDSNPYKHKLSNVEHDNLQTNSGDDALQRNACHDQPQSNVDHGPLNGNHSQGHLQRNVGHDPLQRNSNCNPLQRSTSHNPLGRNTCHDILNVTDDRSGQGQFQGNIVRYKQCGNINEVRNPGVKDEVTERENGRDGHTGGKRSASQILALLGKKKNLFQPPLKRTRLDSGLVVRQSDSEGEAECFAKLDSYPAQSDTLEEENDLNRGRTKEQEEYSRTEDGGKHNSQQQEQRVTESSIGTEPTVIQTDSIDVSENEMEKPAPPSNTHYKPFPQKQSGHMTGRRRPLHQMQPPFQSPSSYLPVSSQTGKFQAPTLKKQHLTSGSVCPQKNLSDDLMFPSLEDATSAVIPQRQVRIPTIFQDAATYKLVLTAVLKEHLNIILFQVAHDFFTALSKVDVSTYSSTKGITKGVDTQNPPCQHKQPSKKVCVKKDGPNKGRFFFTCSNTRGNQCKFFQWADHKTQRSSKGQPNRSEREALSDAKSIEMYMKSFGVSLYCECQLLRKSPFPDSIPGAPAWIKKYRQQKLNNERKKLYLRLSRKEGSSVYGKDDLWVISKDLRFDSNQSFLAKSVFHGPNSSSELEIEPLGGYSPSNWPNEAIVHAIHAYNASTELTCLDNIKEFVNQRTLPILPALLKRNHSSQPVIQSHTTFKSPAIASSMGRTLHCSDDQIRHLADSIVCKYSLNEDQAQALRGVAEMLTSDDANVPPVTLIHGVFGAGKSYLLAVTVLFLTQLFQLHQDGGGDPNDWKVLISSTTNVAVDRILLSLLELGFEDFIRVGSIRKIAKPVLPYSVHASDKSNQELKELQEMLRGDLSPAEKNFVRKSIERQRLGLNKKMLSKVLVVGVTCAACTFPCIHNLKFPVVLLDECSQITEPACLLPVARFECQKLVLVGDPKQLDPTIQGSEPTHDTSLEQTLFDRLLLMGYEPTLLRTQYRCHPRISAIANELFYENKLLDGVTEEQRGKLTEGFPTLCFFNVANGKECCTTGGSYLNDKEGAFVVTMIEMLVGTGVEPSQIGVITLYKAQVAHVTVLLQQSRLGNMKEIKAIQISTVDAFQGGEKDIIILSCVRTDFMGFAASDKRTNVALTRSRDHLLIVGNQRILSANSLWKRVIAKCRECPKGIQDSAAVLKKWAPKLAEIRLDAEKEKKQAKSKKSKKICNTQSTVLSIQSEHASSPPLSLGSTVDEEDQSVPEVVSVSTPGKSFQEQPTDFKNFDSVTELTQETHMQDDVFCADQFASFSHNPDEHCPQQVECGLADHFAVDGSAFEVFQSNFHRENKGNISEAVSGNKLTVNEKSHQNLGEVSNLREAGDEESKPGEMTADYREAFEISGNKDMLEASLNDSPSYSPLGDDALVDSGDSDEELPNFDFDMDV